MKTAQKANLKGVQGLQVLFLSVTATHSLQVQVSSMPLFRQSLVSVWVSLLVHLTIYMVFPSSISLPKALQWRLNQSSTLHLLRFPNDTFRQRYPLVHARVKLNAVPILSLFMLSSVYLNSQLSYFYHNYQSANNRGPIAVFFGGVAYIYWYKRNVLVKVPVPSNLLPERPFTHPTFYSVLFLLLYPSIHNCHPQYPDHSAASPHAMYCAPRSSFGSSSTAPGDIHPSPSPCP